MFNTVETLGIVIDVLEIGEYDKRVVLLTAEQGKVVAFAKGARRANSSLMASTDLFCFGSFYLSEGKDVYYINSVEPIFYFDELRSDYLATCYGSYFLEYAGHFVVEGLAAKPILNLLFMALKSLNNVQLDKELVKLVFEMKMFAYNGEYPEFNHCVYCGASTSYSAFSFERKGLICRQCSEEKMMGRNLIYLSPTAVYALKFILATEPKKLFTFKLKQEAHDELEHFVTDFKSEHLKHGFKSLRVLEEMKRGF